MPPLSRKEPEAPVFPMLVLKAAREDDLELLRTVMNKGADVNMTDADGYSALMICAREGQFECLCELIDGGCQLNFQDSKSERTALMFAASEGHADCVRALVTAGCHLNTRAERGMTALLWATKNNNTLCARILIDAGCELDWFAQANDLDNHHGRTIIAPTALHWAAKNGNAETALALIKAGCDFEIDTTEGGGSITPLMVAATYRDAACVRILIEVGCELDREDSRGRTAVLWAAQKQRLSCVRELISAGCLLTVIPEFCTFFEKDQYREVQFQLRDARKGAYVALQELVQELDDFPITTIDDILSFLFTPRMLDC